MRAARLALGMLLLLAAPPLPALAWGNGCASCNPGYPFYGPHDAIANASLSWAVFEIGAEPWTWLKRWVVPFGGDYQASYDPANLAPTAHDNWLAWTDDPDSAFRDWPNHLFMVHPRPGHTERGAPARVAQLYQDALATLTAARRTTGDERLALEHRAAYDMGLMAHYIGDMSQAGHTDYTIWDHTYPPGESRTYHGLYESLAWNSPGLAALDAALDQSPSCLDPMAYPAEEVELLARRVNGPMGSAVNVTDRDGSTVMVGRGYWGVLQPFRSNFDANVTRLGMRGYDDAVWYVSVVHMRASVELLGRMMVQINLDASAAAAAGRPGGEAC